MLKKKLVAAVIGMGIALGSTGVTASVIGPIKNNCQWQLEQCLSSSTNMLLCHFQYQNCLK